MVFNKDITDSSLFSLQAKARPFSLALRNFIAQKPQHAVLVCSRTLPWLWQGGML